MNNISISIAKYTALEVVHNRLLWIVAMGAGAAIGAGFFGYALAITESQETQTAFMSYMLRLGSMFIVCLIVVNTMSRELNDKSLDMLLSLAITRSTYYFGKLVGFSSIIFFIVVIYGTCMLITAELQDVFIWSVSLFCELFLVLCFSLLCVLSLKQVPMVIIIVVAFYLLSRSINAAVLMMNNSLLNTDSFANTLMMNMLHGISFLLPDLSGFTRSDWLIYNNTQWSELGSIALQTLIYSVLLISASLIDFYRKNI